MVRVAWAVEACRRVTVAVRKGFGREDEGARERSWAGVRRGGCGWERSTAAVEVSLDASWCGEVVLESERVLCRSVRSVEGCEDCLAGLRPRSVFDCETGRERCAQARHIELTAELDFIVTDIWPKESL